MTLLLGLTLVSLAFGISVGADPEGSTAAAPTPVDVIRPLTRSTIRMAAFGTTRLPDARPFVQRDRSDSRFPYATRIDRLTVRLAAGFTSVAYDLWPRHWNGRTIVYHNGHGQDPAASPHVLTWFISRGWRVVTMAMPLAGENAAPGFDRGKYGLHDELVRLKRPLGVFLEPVVAVVNYTGADVMIGLSGGGWTTVAAAAIDPRIRRSYSVAGSIPRRWSCLPPGLGCQPDLEQRMIPNYLRLYELGSEPPRRQLALYNLNDWCCFAGRSSRIWGPLVRGNFDADIDLSSSSHTVTPRHLRLITSDLREPN